MSHYLSWQLQVGTHSSLRTFLKRPRQIKQGLYTTSLTNNPQSPPSHSSLYKEHAFLLPPAYDSPRQILLTNSSSSLITGPLKKRSCSCVSIRQHPSCCHQE